MGNCCSCYPRATGEAEAPKPAERPKAELSEAEPPKAEAAASPSLVSML